MRHSARPPRPAPQGGHRVKAVEQAGEHACAQGVARADEVDDGHRLGRHVDPSLVADQRRTLAPPLDDHELDVRVVDQP